MSADRRYWGLVTALAVPVLAAVVQRAGARGLEGISGAQVHGPPRTRSARCPPYGLAPEKLARRAGQLARLSCH